MLFVLFKQKTAYEMRISDWSSDVCSSDLLHHLAEMRCADRLALADEAAAHVHRMLAGDLGDALVDQAPALADRAHLQFLIYLQPIGRASCRERVCQYV